MRTHKMTAYDAGQDLIACADFLGEKEEEAAKGGYKEQAQLIRNCRVRIANYFNRNNRKTHDFGLGPTRRK